MIGNNNNAIGVHRLNVLLYDPQNLNPVTAVGRYYLPDNTFLKDKHIVAIQTLLYAPGSSLEYPMPVNSPSESVLGVTCRYAQIGELDKCYLTLYDHSNKLVIENFPLLQLDNNQWLAVGVNNTTNKLIPIDGKFNLRESFITTPSVNVGSNTQVALAFYYKK